MTDEINAARPLDHCSGPTQLKAADFVAGLGAPLQLVAMHPDNGAIDVVRADDAAGIASGLIYMRRRNQDGRNIYAEANISTARNRRSGSGDITHVRAVVGDVDAKDGRTIEDCMQAVTDLPVPPTFTVHSGGGLQLWYLLDEPVAASPGVAGRHRAVGQLLAARIDGDAVFDMPRMMRMPGFTNYPNAKKRVTGRGPVKARITGGCCVRYTLDALERALGLGSFAETAPALPRFNPDTNAVLTGGLVKPPWFDHLSPTDKNACLAELLRVPAVVALADTSDASPGVNWRTVVAACARSGAPNAFDLCQQWARTSQRYDELDFATRWKSYADG